MRYVISSDGFENPVVARLAMVWINRQVEIACLDKPSYTYDPKTQILILITQVEQIVPLLTCLIQEAAQMARTG